MSERMTADEARALLAGMTPGTLEVTEMRDGRLADAGEQELAVSIHDDARAFQKPDGTWHSVIVCRGMDGPTREANAAAFASVKRALATVAATAPDDTRAQAAGACDVAAIGARLHAIDREGVRSIDDALVMGAAITDPSTGDVEWILRHAPDVIDCLADAVRRFTAAAAADVFADRVRACHAAAARVERYTLPAEVLALIADVPALLDALAREREAHAAEVAGARAAALREAAASEASELAARDAAMRGTLAAPSLATMRALHRAGGCWLVSYDDDDSGDPVVTIEYLDGARSLAEKEGDNPVRWVAVDRCGRVCLPPQGDDADGAL